MTRIRFTKMHGIGNDYVFINAMEQAVDEPESLAKAVSDRHLGVGSDGLILILPPDQGIDAHLRMRIFNADGSEAEMCGNGIRCLCKYAYDHELCRARPMRVETGAGVLSLEYTLGSGGEVDQVTVDMSEPVLEADRIPVFLPRIGAGSVVDLALDRHIPMNASARWMKDCGLDMRMTCLSMGNPHMIVYCRRVDAVPLESAGPFLETQPIFPRRINVHFAQVRSRSEVSMRSWERGGGATLACGTGACAVCVAGVLTGRTDRRLRAHLPGGDLDLQWDEASNHVFMTGPAVEVFAGELSV